MNSKCIYCGCDLERNSSEYIIQNAIGGLLESLDLYCPNCNEAVAKLIDVPFTKIFTPIVANISSFQKSRPSGDAS